MSISGTSDRADEVPADEVLLLKCIAVQAVGMAADGEPSDGYVHLLYAVGRVQGLRDGGQLWGEELVTRYRRVADEFAALYRIARE